MDKYFDSELKPAKFAAAVAVAGIVIGISAWILKWLVVKMMNLALLPLHRGMTAGWWLVILPIAGITAVGWIVRRIVRTPLEEGVEKLKAKFLAGDTGLPIKLWPAYILTCALTVGTGGSAGAEGPISVAGAAVSSNIARRFGMSQREILFFMACGGGAAIAAIFKSPMGGFFFTIEILHMSMGFLPVLVLGAMCMLASLTAYALSGFSPDVGFYTAPVFDWHMMPAILVTGLACGLYSVYYRLCANATAARFKTFRRPVLMNIVSGATVGIFLLLFPALYGEGYGVLSSLAQGHTQAVTEGSFLGLMPRHLLLPLSLAGILLAKPFACYASNHGGGVAGDFTPTLFAGGMAGALLALCWPDAGVTTDLFMICGMAGAMAGIIRAPMMTIFIATEMTGMPYTMMPIAITVGVSYAVSRFLQPSAQ